MAVPKKSADNTNGKEPRQDNRKRAWDIQHAIHEEMRERLRLREGRSVTELVKEANRGARVRRRR